MYYVNIITSVTIIIDSQVSLLVRSFFVYFSFLGKLESFTIFDIDVEDGHTLHLVVRQPFPPSSENLPDTSG